MKRKGISLIVLIITIVVIIILATAIIVNLAQTNIINNAKEATVKQDISTLQDELDLYIADKYVDTFGEFDATTLNATDKDEIAQIIPSIKGTKYEDYVTIENGKIAISETMPEPDKTWAMEELGLTNTTTNTPTEPEVPTTDTTAPTAPTSLELTSTKTSITAVASGSTDENNFVYEYSIDNTTWQENGEITNLTLNTEYTVYARAKDEAGNVSDAIDKKISTKYNQIAVNTPVENENATIYGEKPAYNNPVVPVGFKAVNTTDATWSDTNSDGFPDGWNNGLVIQDGSLNQFVWVPVDRTNVTYAKWCTSYTSTSDDTEALPTVNGTTIDENAQITKYGGFYIGRYEAGVPGKTGTPSNSTGKPTVQQGATVWTNIDYTNSNASAKLFVNTDNVKSGLVTGTQWDTAMKWIENAGISVTDSTSWGNYSDDPVDGNNGKKTAGFKEEWRAKNIYDLAGNTWEWTGEIYSTSRILRGGRYSFSGSTYPASYRYNYGPSGSGDSASFRLSLYIM